MMIFIANRLDGDTLDDLLGSGRRNAFGRYSSIIPNMRGDVSVYKQADVAQQFVRKTPLEKSRSFTRGADKPNFEEQDKKPTEIFLKLKDSYPAGGGRKLEFQQLKEMIPYSAACWFQKLPIEKGRSVHRLFVKTSEKQMLELRGFLSMVGNGIDPPLYYFVPFVREVGFKIPKGDTFCETCVFVPFDGSENLGTSSNDFKELYERVEALGETELTLEVNRQKDRKIWDGYINALKAIVQDKDVRWKIEKAEYKPTENGGHSGGNNKDTNGKLIITIDEGELNEKFKSDLEEIFAPPSLSNLETQAEASRGIKKREEMGQDLAEVSPHEAACITVEDERALVEFNTLRDIASGELDAMKIAAAERGFEPAGSPEFGCKIDVRFPHAGERGEIFACIEKELKSQWDIDIHIAPDGCFETSSDNIEYIERLIKNRFGSEVIFERQGTALQVSFALPSGVLEDKISAVLDGMVKNGKLKYNGAQLENLGEAKIAVDINAYLEKGAFQAAGFEFLKTVNRYKGQRAVSPQVACKVKGVYIEEGFYCADGLKNMRESNRVLAALKEAAGDQSLKARTTRHIFRKMDAQQDTKKIQRKFKALVDIADKVNFNIMTSHLEVFTETESEYDAILKDVRQKCHEAGVDAKVEVKAMSGGGKITPVLSATERKKQAVDSVLSELRKRNITSVGADKDLSSVFCRADMPETCRMFKRVLPQICEDLGGKVQVNLETLVETTRCEFQKSEEITKENEDTVRKNLLREEFVVEIERQDTPTGQKDVQKQNSKNGAKGNKDELKVGTLIRKTGKELTFRVCEEFKKSFDSGRISESTLKGEYIRPSFVGELANINRMISAMGKMTNPMRFGVPANRGLSDFIFDAREAGEITGDIEECKSVVLANLNEPQLNDRQIEAVVKSLLAPDLSIIQGPPGTGKTTVIAEIIWQTLLRNPEAKILVSSQTNLAVDNALERLKGKKVMRPLRIGNADKFEDFGKPYSDKRIELWASAKPRSDVETFNADNAVAKWIKQIAEHCGDDAEIKGVVEEWKEWLLHMDTEGKQQFSNAYVKRVNVFAATCSECGSRRFTETFNEVFSGKVKQPRQSAVFDVVIVDETSKATPPELALPVVLGMKIVLIGDHKQLPPMIDENDFMEALEKVGAKNLVEDWTRKDYKTSQFEKLFCSATTGIKTSLDTQYRMHAKIMACVSQFYKDQKELERGLVCGITGEMDKPDFQVKASRYHGLENNPLLNPDTHAIWVNVDGDEEKVGTSYKNEQEVVAVKTVLKALCKAKGFKEYRDYFGEDEEIGVITFYLPQMLAIRDALYPDMRAKGGWKNFEQHKGENEFHLPFRINTVDRFQGMERNIIIVSTVRSSSRKTEDGKTTPNKDLGFARECPRINVAFSRAKRLLIVVGNQGHFCRKPEYENAVKNMYKIDIKQLRKYR